jgi:hypothetical protein
MGTITYFPKGSSYSSTQGVTLWYPAVAPKMILIVGHGRGERNDGAYYAGDNTRGILKSFSWGGWGNIKAKADIYGIILIFINTTSNYENGEYQNALTWARARYPTLINMIWVIGHSLGSYGAGKYAFEDATFASRIAGWIMSASGNFLSGVNNLYTNLVNNNVKFWGVTATNDTVSDTSPAVITTVYAQLKALNSNAHAIRTVFPSTEWPNDYPVDAPTGSKTAHNAVLSRITGSPLYYSKGNWYLITQGITSSLTIKMNVYQWMLSNPKTSIYQDPTLTFSGPKYSNPVTPPPPPPAPPQYFKSFIFTPPVFGITWTDGTNTSTTLFSIPSGYEINQVYTNFSSVDGEVREYLKVELLSGATPLNKTFGPRKP